MRAVAVQLAVGAAMMLGGAWLVGWWMVGLIVMLFGAVAVVSAVLWDVDDKPAGNLDSHRQVLERYRRAR